MGFWSSIGNAISSAASWVGSSISKAVSWAGSGLTTLISKGGEMVGSLVGGLAGKLMDTFGLRKKDDPDVSGWGDRAMQAEEQSIYPEQFDDFGGYLDALRKFDLDAEKSKDSTPEMKTLKGLEVTGRALEDKLDAPEGSMARMFVLGAIHPDFFTSERFSGLLNSGTNVNDIADYFEGRLGGAESLDIEESLIHAEQKADPSKDSNAVRQELYHAADVVQEKLNNINDL